MSCHLFQPLFVNTDIFYSLDMSKFPGLDDPQHMYEPALLIETPWTRQEWSSAITHVELRDDIDDILAMHGNLSDSCNLFSPWEVASPPVNDFISELPSGGELRFLEEINTFPNFDPPCAAKKPGCEPENKAKDHIWNKIENTFPETKDYFAYCDDFAHLFISESEDANFNDSSRFKCNNVFAQHDEVTNDNGATVKLDAARYDNSCRRES